MTYNKRFCAVKLVDKLQV